MEAVCYHIAKDMLHLDTVSDEGFLHMLYEFEPRYNLLSRKALTTHYLLRLYQQQLDQVKASLSDSQYSIFAMVIGTWFFHANDSYIGYTLLMMVVSSYWNYIS